MGRMKKYPCCKKHIGVKKGPWSSDEDQKLISYIHLHGHKNWRAVPSLAGLNRCGKSCRLRWKNYLRPDINRREFTLQEEHIVLNLHAIWGSKWATIASKLPGRTDNDVKNLWNTKLKKKLMRMGFDPATHLPRTEASSSIVTKADQVGNVVARLQSDLAKLQHLNFLVTGTAVLPLDESGDLSAFTFPHPSWAGSFYQNPLLPTSTTACIAPSAASSTAASTSEELDYTANIINSSSFWAGLLG